MGHTAFGFADEYEYYAGCGSGEAGHDVYAGGEPVEPNVTCNTDRASINGSRCCRRRDALPTTANAKLQPMRSAADPRAPDYVGAYEGARYMHCGCYRPSYYCRMPTLGQRSAARAARRYATRWRRTSPRYQGLWRKSPAGSESGPGTNIATRTTHICHLVHE